MGLLLGALAPLSNRVTPPSGKTLLLDPIETTTANLKSLQFELSRYSSTIDLSDCRTHR